MKKHLPLLAALVALAAVAYTLRAPRNPGAFDVAGFGRLPTLLNGRVKPLDTVARTSLLVLQGRQRVTAPDGRTLPPTEWLLEMLYHPHVADTYQVFEVVHPDVLALMNLNTSAGAGGKRFSLGQLRKGLPDLDRQAKLANGTEAAVRTPFQRAIVQLFNAVLLYQHLQTSLVASGSDDFLAQLANLERVADIRPANGGPATAPATPAQDPHGSGAATVILEMARVFASMEVYAYLRVVPPTHAEKPEEWHTISWAWSKALETRRVEPAALAFANLGRAWRARDAQAFNAAVADYSRQLERDFPAIMRKSTIEMRFNSAEPFYSSTALYVVAFLVGVISWLKWPGTLVRSAYYLTAIAFTLTTAGILARMWLESRPPVTNLYSSALFVGWGAVALCLVLERIHRNAIGSVTAGIIGVGTLVIAHHLALGGDTMEMMRAVLDSNFWLATHVITIAIGYSATFLAGFLAIIYVLRGALTRSLDPATASALTRMIYGSVCFATLFSFVGTILGGIWADQSWGRFWGWDPKENGALLIVLWNAIILHARWGGLVKARGFASLTIFGNIVTAWSWFGVNMLGVGLHSYGFMDAAFWWLVLFCGSQLAIILIAALPAANWRSPRTADCPAR